jgi:micrococcal nuclease
LKSLIHRPRTSLRGSPAHLDTSARSFPLARWLLPLALTVALGRVAAGQGTPGTVLKPGPTCRVVRVVDGDTVVVQLDGRQTTIRLIGLDTPETVAPGRPVEGYGKEASAYPREMVGGKSVRLEYEPAMRRVDKFGRTLAYLWTVPDGKLVNLAIVEGGYGHAYTAFPFSMIERFRQAEREAREEERGLWGDGLVKPDDKSAMATPKVGAKVGPKAEAKPGAKVDDQTGPGTTTVYVTTSGSKYHRADCRYLSKSSIPRTLADLPAKYAACSVCEPSSR